MLERVRTFAFAATARHFANGFAQNILRIFSVAIQILDNFFHGDGTVFRMPAIVIGDHGDSGVAKFGFAGELGFGDVSHANDIEAQLAVNVSFGERGKLRALHANVGAAAVNFHGFGFARSCQHFGDFGARWLVEADVRDDSIAEKCGYAQTGLVVKLIGDQKIERAQIFFQGAHGADGNNSLDAEHFHGANIGAVIDFSGENAMSAAVAREKGDVAAFEFAENERIGGIAEWRFDADLAGIPSPGMA